MEAQSSLAHAVLRGFSFGLTSGVLTPLGLMVGLRAGSGSDHAVAAGILSIAIADALSDSLGMHVAQEASGSPPRDVWGATFATFLAKFGFALTFLVPIWLFDLDTAVLVCIAWGVSLMTVLTWVVSRGDRPWGAVFEHLGIAALVIAGGQAAGMAIDRWA